MKTKLFLVALFSLFFSLNQSVAGSDSNIQHNDPDVKVVVSQKRIWLMTDEISVKCLTVQVTNEQGRVVAEKYLSSKTTDWSLNIESLPAGNYTVMIGSKKMTQFSR